MVSVWRIASGRSRVLIERGVGVWIELVCVGLRISFVFPRGHGRGLGAAFSYLPGRSCHGILSHQDPLLFPGFGN